ncbi:MAG TPA: hypothetical protein VEU06_11700 [Micropepsaceae bacterium]|nr:hypothetical protein [Micropepsaceae bacterium]
MRGARLIVLIIATAVVMFQYFFYLAPSAQPRRVQPGATPDTVGVKVLTQDPTSQQ